MTQKQKKLAAEIRKGLKFLAKRGSATDIAAYFEAVGIRGRTHSSCGCPVACFLKIRACNREILVSTDTVFDSDKYQNPVTCPTSVVQFIKDFDERAFPHLIAP